MAEHKRHARVAIPVLALTLLLGASGAFETLESTLLDLRFRIRGTRPVDPRIVILSIDDDALKGEGRWQDWGMSRHELPVRLLSRLGARSLFFDIFFVDPEQRRLDPERLLAAPRDSWTRRELEAALEDGQGAFREAIAAAGNVFLAEIFEREAFLTNERHEFHRLNLERRLATAGRDTLSPPPAGTGSYPEAAHFLPVLADLAEAARGSGFAQVIPDPDGVVRHVPLFFRYRDRLWPGLNLLSALELLGTGISNLRFPSKNLMEIALPDGSTRRIPLGDDGRMMVNWYGPYLDSFDNIPYGALKTLAANLLLRDFKALGRRQALDPQDPDAALALPGVADKVRELVGGTAAMRRELVAETLRWLYLAGVYQQLLDESPDASDAAILALTGIGPDEAEPLALVRNLRYHGLLAARPELVTNTAFDGNDAEFLERERIADPQLFRECLGNARSYGLSAADYPYYFFPPPLLESLGGPLYPDYFRGRVFFYGLTASGTHDLNPMPYESRYPMVGLHATVVNNLLEGTFLERAPGMLNLAYALLLSAAAFFLLGSTRTARQALAGGSLLALHILANLVLFIAAGIWFDLLVPGLALAATTLAIGISDYRFADREKKRIRGAFSLYVAPAVVDSMLRDPDRLRLGGEKRECTVFFSDIQGFTTISERLSPEKLVELLNLYLTEVTDIILRHGGMVDKFEGDAVMAVFGAPLDMPEHAEAACAAALEIQQRLAELNTAWEAEGRPALTTRIGLNTGEMIAGNMGSRDRFDYTVMGDAVNLGARLEGANKVYGTRVMISGNTRSKLGERFIVRELDLIRVKGKTEPVSIYELVADNKAGAPVR